MGQVDRTGLLFAISSYLFWGMVPFYFWAVKEVSAWEVVSHRIIWSVVCLAAILRYQRRLIPTLMILKDRKALMGMLASSVLVLTNWLIFIYAISSGQTLKSSFGYYILPLFSIALGALVLGEKLSRGQFVALLFAGLGIVYQVVLMGELPWISLGLALTFGTYGLIRKQINVGPMQGVFIEAALAIPAAFIILAYQGQAGQLLFGGSLKLSVLLTCAGFATFIPLWLFSEGAKRIPLSANGFLQFLTPTLHFFVAVFAFGEPLNKDRLISFGFVWIGLAMMIAFPYIQRRVQSFREYRLRRYQQRRPQPLP